MVRRPSSRTLALTAPLLFAFVAACGGAPAATGTPTTAPATTAAAATTPAATATAGATETAAATSPAATETAGTTAAPTETAAATESPAATSPAATETAGASPTAGTTGSPAASPSGPATDPAAALGELDSYRFTLRVQGIPMGATVPAGTVVEVAGTVVHTPAEALRIDMKGVPIPGLPGASAGGTVTDATVTIVGDNAWVTAAGQTVPVPAAALAGVAFLLPESFAQQMLSGSAGQTQAVGQETKNGIPTTHFQLTETALAQMRQSLGSTDATFDLWIAQEGFLTALEMGGKRTDEGGQQVDFEIDVQITNPNDPANVVTPPAGS